MSYESYSHYGMKPKSEMLKSSYVTNTSSYDHEKWLGKSLEENWKMVMQRYSDTMQKNILRAVAVAGVDGYRWNTLFTELYNGTGKYQSIHRNWLEYRSTPSAHDLVKLIESEHWYTTHYPVHCPVLLIAYGYSQNDYLYELNLYWSEIDDAYRVLWDNSRIGIDSPAVAQMRRIGQEAISEIDRMSISAQQANKRF